MAVIVGSARSDENGKSHSGKAGDQNNGKEVSTQNWYKHSKGWRVLRANDPVAMEKIAQSMQWACDSNLIGYDQWQRDTLYNALKDLDFDIRKLAKAVETDCSALVRVCMAFAFGHDIITGDSRFSTANMCSRMLQTGLFTELIGSKYTDSSDYLKRGDVLCTKTQGHVVVVLSDGAKAKTTSATTSATSYTLGKRTLRKGDKGNDVVELQAGLIRLDYPLGNYGANKDGIDGDFGAATEKAVMDFQQDHGLEIDGIFGPASFAAFKAALNKPADQYVEVTGGSVNVREDSTTAAKIVFVAHKGDKYAYGGMTAKNGWHSLMYGGKTLWISGKYSELRCDYKAKGKIADLSKWQGSIDWAKAAQELDFCILRAAYTCIKKDERFDEYAAACEKHGIPFGVYQFSTAKSMDEAIKEADFLWNAAKDHKPVFWVYDCEEDGMKREFANEWVKRMRALGAKRVGLYIAHHKYKQFDLDVDNVDFVWIPRYGSNDGKQHKVPDYRCDLWQFTSKGTLSGVNGDVDLNVITGTGKSLTWFRGGV